jgi:hypothetical protein
MDAKTQQNIKGATDGVVQDLMSAKDYRAMQMVLIETEAKLGGIERKEFQNKEPDLDYIDALDSAWGTICVAALKKTASLAGDDASLEDDLNASADDMRVALHDNYLHGALAAVIAAGKDESMRKLPLLAAAAFNKHTYNGYQDEIACLRMMLWAGYDPNAQTSNGITALHYMASMKSNLASHPRAVRLLLKAGIDPNLKNENGDTPLCYMAGNTTWHEVHTQSAWLLLDNGADPLAEANDGECAYSLLRKNQEISEDVADIVTAIEAVMEKRPDAASDGNDAYYETVGDQIMTLLKAADADGLHNFFGYLMAIVVAKQMGEDDEFAKQITPLMLNGLDGEDLLEKLGDYLEDGDSASIGRIAHAYLSKAAKAQFIKLQASMQE